MMTYAMPASGVGRGGALGARAPPLSSAIVGVATVNITQEKKVCWFYTYRCAKSMSPVLTQCTCAETCTVLKLHTCYLHICAILAYEIVLLLMC